MFFSTVSNTIFIQLELFTTARKVLPRNLKISGGLIEVKVAAEVIQSPTHPVMVLGKTTVVSCTYI